MPRYTAQDGAGVIAEERANQIARGYTAAHDAQHGVQQMVDAALAYTQGEADFGPWPWDEESFNPTDRLTNLAKAGALIASAIDLLLLAGSES